MGHPPFLQECIATVVGKEHDALKMCSNYVFEDHALNTWVISLYHSTENLSFALIAQNIYSSTQLIFLARHACVKYNGVAMVDLS